MTQIKIGQKGEEVTIPLVEYEYLNAPKDKTVINISGHGKKWSATVSDELDVHEFLDVLLALMECHGYHKNSVEDSIIEKFEEIANKIKYENSDED